MSVPEIVTSFVMQSRKKVTRDCIQFNSEDLLNRFDKILDSCTKDIDDEIKPKLIICETYNKYSQLLPVRSRNKQHTYYVLYDCHLDRIMDRLVTIVYSDGDPGPDVWKLAYELFGEEMLLNDNKLLSFYFRLNYIGLGEYKLSIKPSKEIEIIREVQSSYVLAHEVGHWLYSMAREGKETTIINISDTVEHVLENSKVLLFEIYDEYDKKFKDKDYHTLIDEQRNTISDSERMIEECFADAIAYSYIMAWIDAEYGTVEARLMALKALFILMMGMQILAMSNMTFNENSFENSTSVRIVFLRNYLQQYYEDIDAEFLRTVDEIVIQFEDRVTNLILESFSELEDRANNILEAVSSEKYDINELFKGSLN